MNVIIKMKKHPIDDLFAKKLAEHRQEPSQKAFEKFQARLQEKQQKPKVGFFLGNRNWTYYAAAAGIAIALSVGFLTQNDTSVSPTVASADVPSHDAPSHDVPTVKKNSVESVSEVANNQSIASIENKKQTSENTTKQNLPTTKKQFQPVVINTPKNTIANLNPITQSVPNKIVDDSPEEEISVATNTTPIFETPVVETTKPAEQTSQGIFKTDIGESVVVVLEPAAPEAEVIPSISQDSNTSLADAKRLGEEKDEKEKSFIAKLYGEYKHFKYGEKVDLKKLGVKDVLARVDDSVIKEDITDVRDFVQRKVSRLQRKE
ncbi:hypothetical protein GCM10011514_44990 [Emticicia aquatilis]|uniref:Uncharacterized protein n=1 Tax=Emticicia aquatilis TaxID=1537369 RepID=A0A917DW24_9BACT|nr:hypothetical protein [Emticicia aquatilis]GGD76045.1 hypothetical protein GCM10011514_44990 [Emticicia aquatilis]